MVPASRALGRHGRPWLTGPLLLTLPVASCGPVAVEERLVALEVHRSDFEESTWFGLAKRTDVDPHGGRWSGLLQSGGNRSLSAWSPAIPIADARYLDVSFWTHLREIGGGELQVYLYRLADVEPEHPAMPATPRRTGGWCIARVRDPEEDWTRHEHRIDALRFPPDTTAVRLEVRLSLRPRLRGLCAFDDVTVVAHVPEA